MKKNDKIVWNVNGKFFWALSVSWYHTLLPPLLLIAENLRSRSRIFVSTYHLRVSIFFLRVSRSEMRRGECSIGLYAHDRKGASQLITILGCEDRSVEPSSWKRRRAVDFLLWDFMSGPSSIVEWSPCGVCPPPSLPLHPTKIEILIVARRAMETWDRCLGSLARFLPPVFH